MAYLKIVDASLVLYSLIKTYIAIVALALLKIFQATLNENQLHISTLILSRLKTLFDFSDFEYIEFLPYNLWLQD